MHDLLHRLTQIGLRRRAHHGSLDQRYHCNTILAGRPHASSRGVETRGSSGDAEALQHEGDDEVEDKTAREKEQRDRVAARLGAQPRNEHRADDAGSRPGRKHAAVDSAQETRAEEVREVRRHDGEAAARAARDQEDHGLEQEDVARVAELPERNHLHEEEQRVHAAATDVVRNRRPDEAAAAVEEADEADHRRRGPCIHPCR